MAKHTITPEHDSAQEKSIKSHSFKSRPLKSRSFKSRHLKVREGFYDYKAPKDSFKGITVSGPVPWIYIKGFWLQQAGFEIGKKVEVRVTKDRLIIQVISD